MSETLINGYELLPICAGPSPQESIAFTEFENDLGEGMESAVLIGSNTGNRRFKISYPVLSGSSVNKTVEYNGQLFTPEKYLWDLFCRSKVNNTPFVVQSLINDQYYLVKFATKDLTYERMRTKLFTTGIELKQVRRPGVSVFDVSKLAPSGWFKADTLGLANGQDVTLWANSGTGSYAFTGAAPPSYSTPVDNNLGVVRFDGSSDYMTAPGAITIKQVFMVLEMRQDTFSNYAGILTAQSSGGTDAVFVGNSGTTKLTNFSFGSQYVYRKNSIYYAESNQQAPMNKFGLLHARFKNGITLANLQIGKDRGLSGRVAAMDLAETVIFTEHISDSDGRELSEHLLTKW